VPPNADITYEVELLDWEEPQDHEVITFEGLDDEEEQNRDGVDRLSPRGLTDA
jgi:hypothetical protein